MGVGWVVRELGEMTKRRGQQMPDDGPSEADLERFSGVTRPCPKCKADLYDEVEICWKCGHHLSAKDEGPASWIVVTVIVLLTVIIGWWVLR